MQTKQQSLNLFKYRQTIGYVYLMTYVSGEGAFTLIKLGIFRNKFVGT